MERARILYQFMRGNVIDIGDMIFKEMHGTLTKHREALKFPSLIAEMCIAKGVPILPNEDYSMPAPPLDYTKREKDPTSSAFVSSSSLVNMPQRVPPPMEGPLFGLEDAKFLWSCLDKIQEQLEGIWRHQGLDVNAFPMRPPPPRHYKKDLSEEGEKEKEG